MRTCSGDAGQENDDLTGMTAAVQRICLSNLCEQRAKVRAYARPWRLSRYDKRKLAKCVFIFLSGRSSILSGK